MSDVENQDFSRSNPIIDTIWVSSRIDDPRIEFVGSLSRFGQIAQPQSNFSINATTLPAAAGLYSAM
jgi:hypothetical protein